MKALGKYSLSSLIRFIIYAAWYVQLFFLLLLTILLILRFSQKEVIESDFDIRLTQARPVAVAIAPEATGITGAELKLDSGKLHVTQNRSWEWVCYHLGVMWIWFAISLTITFLLRKLFHSLTYNNPFLSANARHLRWIAILIILVSPLEFAQDFFENAYLQKNFLLEGSGIRAHLVIDLKTIFVGLILLIIAEVFRIGTQLKEEQDLTV